MRRRGAGEDERRAIFVRQRPAAVEPGGPLAGQRISRRQLLLEPASGQIEVKRVGRCPISVNGRTVDQATLVPGDTLQIDKQLVLYFARRPHLLTALRNYPVHRMPTFGGADGHGIVGESP
ncbi:MAG: sigma-54-dependent Fis family transcriptional regulator, partial [Myxococcota bacterium]|nr:sigma-54-dependent Fis family transcriptional regulator [Myxococcota bacterium]